MLAIKFDKCRAIAHAPDITVHVNENPGSSPIIPLGGSEDSHEHHTTSQAYLHHTPAYNLYTPTRS